MACVVAATVRKPEVLLLQLHWPIGSHFGAESGGPRLCEEDFRHVTERIVEAAEEFCGGRVVSVLEGGYSPPVLRRCVAAHVRGLMGVHPPAGA